MVVFVLIVFVCEYVIYFKDYKNVRNKIRFLFYFYFRYVVLNYVNFSFFRVVNVGRELNLLLCELSFRFLSGREWGC